MYIHTYICRHRHATSDSALNRSEHMCMHVYRYVFITYTIRTHIYSYTYVCIYRYTDTPMVTLSLIDPNLRSRTCIDTYLLYMRSELIYIHMYIDMPMVTLD